MDKTSENFERYSDILPVIYGDSLNAQSLAKEFYDGYGLKPLVITENLPWSIKYSSILTPIAKSGTLLQTLRIIEKLSESRLLLLSTSDVNVEEILEVKDEISDRWTVPYPDLETYNAMTQKGEFSRLAAELGVPHPLTIEVGFSDDGPDLSSIILDGALWVKPTKRLEWKTTSIEDRHKVYRAENMTEAQAVLDVISQESDFSGTFVVQEEIPGDNDQLVSVDIFCYYGQAVVKVAGRKLLEEKGALTIGNALSIISGNVPQQGIDDAVRMLEHLKWHGWVNFDGKIDSRTGQVVFFEANPRLGRSHHYITVGGYNAVTPYMNLVNNEPIETSDNLFKEDRIYSIIPFENVFETLTDDEIIPRVDGALQHTGYVNPLDDEDDQTIQRERLLEEQEVNKWWIN